jgi:hypothetical protein
LIKNAFGAWACHANSIQAEIVGGWVKAEAFPRNSQDFGDYSAVFPSQNSSERSGVCCIFSTPAHARNMRLDGRGRNMFDVYFNGKRELLLVSKGSSMPVLGSSPTQVAEEQEESVPSQRREKHWVGWRCYTFLGWL